MSDRGWLEEDNLWGTHHDYVEDVLARDYDPIILTSSILRGLVEAHQGKTRQRDDLLLGGHQSDDGRT